jgi:hypothetical protein
MKPPRPSDRTQHAVPPQRAHWPTDVIGGKYVRQLQQYLDQLREEAPHGNRKLFLDDVFVAYLLAFFNPTLRTLRTIEDFSQSRQAQRHLSTTKICRSTLSDFNRLVDPERLAPLLEALRPHVAARRTAAAGQGDVARLLASAVAVDGTFLPALAETAWAVRALNQTSTTRRRARLDAQVSVVDGLPEAIVVPAPGQSESAAAAAQVAPGKLYLYDRGFNGFDLINAHYDADGAPRARFVVRYRAAGRNAPDLDEVETLPLSADDLAAGVTSDRTGRFVTAHGQAPPVRLRETILEIDVRGRRQRLRLISNLTDGVSAAPIGLLYRQRWQVELFFRWLKCFGHFNHLLSTSRQGVQAQFYVTVIAAMLMYLHTGGRPSKYLFSLMSLVAGGALLEEILPILRERERQCELARRSAAKRRAQAQRS